MAEPLQAGSGNGRSANGRTRIGVFVCHCGGNISDVVDVKRVAAHLAGDGVEVAATHQFMCSDPGQALIEQSIRDHHLNRVVVAACSPTLHQLTFRRTLERAGMNQFLFEHVNIREQVSWVVVDKEQAFISSANFTEAAQRRNIEVGVLLRFPALARRLAEHFDALASSGLVLPVPL
jgi:heterodisulfide reductase subunit A